MSAARRLAMAGYQQVQSGRETGLDRIGALVRDRRHHQDIGLHNCADDRAGRHILDRDASHRPDGFHAPIAFIGRALRIDWQRWIGGRSSPPGREFSKPK